MRPQTWGEAMLWLAAIAAIFAVFCAFAWLCA
jgi:hypothetical protein